MVPWHRFSPFGGSDTSILREIRQEIAVALNTTQQFGLQNLDHLLQATLAGWRCFAACNLSRPELRKLPKKQAAQLVARVKQVGAFICFPNFPRYLQPWFLQGTSVMSY